MIISKPTIKCDFCGNYGPEDTFRGYGFTYVATGIRTEPDLSKARFHLCDACLNGIIKSIRPDV